MSTADMSTATPTSGWQYTSIIVTQPDYLGQLNSLAQQGWRVASSSCFKDGFLWILLEKPLPAVTG